MNDNRKPLSTPTALWAAGLSFVIYADFSGSLGLFPAIERDLRADIILGPKIISVFLLGLGLSLAFIRCVLQHLGLKKVAIVSSLSYAVLGLMIFFIKPFPILLMLRFLQGMAVAFIYFSTYNLLLVGYAQGRRYHWNAALIGFASGPAWALLCIYFLSWPFFYVFLSLISLIGSIGLIKSLHSELDYSAKKPANTFLSFVYFSLILLCFLALIEIAYLKNISFSVSMSLFFVLLLALVLLFYRESNPQTAVFFDAQIKALHNKDSLWIAFASGFILMPIFMAEMLVFFRVIHHQSMLTLNVYVFVASLCLCAFFVIGKALCTRYRPLMVLSLGLIILLINFIFRLTVYDHIYSILPIVQVILFSCGLGIIISAGSWSENAKGAYSSVLASSHLLIFSLGALIGNTILQKIFIYHLVHVAKLKMIKGLLLMPSDMTNNTQIIPLIFSYSRHPQEDTPDVQASLIPKLYDIYVSAYAHAMHFLSLTIIGIIAVLLIVIFYKLKHNKP